MNTGNYFTAPKTLRRIHVGPLGPYVDSFVSWLQEQHYSRSSVQSFVRAVSDWSRWLHVHGVGSNDVGAKQLEGFVRYRAQHARNGAVDQDGRRGLQKMLVWLQKTGVASQSNVPAPLSDREIIVHEFGQYLLRQRGISSRTLRGYLPYISQFLEECFGHEVIKVETLRAQDVIGFVRRNSRTLGHSSVQHRVTVLRAFLRYLRHKGQISIDLAACVPSVASWSFSALPKFLLPAQVQLVLDQCDRSTSKGRRDYAICCWRGSDCEPAKSRHSRSTTSTGNRGTSHYAAKEGGGLSYQSSSKSVAPYPIILRTTGRRLPIATSLFENTPHERDSRHQPASRHS
jgi:site-specific recombinase XerD